jgi:ATP-binding cassette subfamily B protein
LFERQALELIKGLGEPELATTRAARQSVNRTDDSSLLVGK